MKVVRRFVILIFILVAYSATSQNTHSIEDNSNAYYIIRTSMGTSGSTNTITTSTANYNVSQSIGQSSVIGTSYGNHFFLRQGYQQPPLLSDTHPAKGDDALEAKIYPNPFSHLVFISFSESITKEIRIFLFDIKGSLIHTQVFTPSQLIKLNLGNLSNGFYILHAQYENRSLWSKLIKNKL